MYLNKRSVKCITCHSEMESLFFIANESEFTTIWYYHCLKCHSLFKSTHGVNQITKNSIKIFLTLLFFIVALISSIIFYVHLKEDGIVVNLPIVTSFIFSTISIYGIYFVLKNYNKKAYGKLDPIENNEFEIATKAAAKAGTLTTHNSSRLSREIIKVLSIMALTFIFLNFKHLIGL